MLPQHTSALLLGRADPVAAISDALAFLVAELGCDRALITFADETRYHTLSFGAYSPPIFEHLHHLPIGSLVTEDQASVAVSDVITSAQWRDPAGTYPGIAGYVGIPLRQAGQIVGVLNLLYRTSTKAQAAPRPILEKIADQIANLIEQAQILQMAAQRERFADELVMMSVTLGEILDETELLNAICEQSLQTFAVQNAYLWLLHDEYLVGATAVGLYADTFRGQRLFLSDEQNGRPGSFAARIVRERRAIYLNGQPGELYKNAYPTQTGGTFAMLGVPLMRGAHMLGVLIVVDSHDPKRFDEFDRDQLLLFGAQAALAIQNVRLFAETRRRLDQLRLVNEVGRVATSILMLEPLMESIAQSLFQEFHYDVISLLLVEDGTLHVNSLLTETGRITIPSEQRKQPVGGAAALAARSYEPVLRHDQLTLSMRLAGAPPEAAQGIHELALPLIITQEVIGVLNIERRVPISTDELDLLEALATQIAITVGNSHLFDMVQQQMIELDSRVMSATLQLRVEKEHTDAILQSVADAVVTTDMTGTIVTTNPVAGRVLTAVGLDAEGNPYPDPADLVRKLVSKLLNSETAAFTESLELNGRAYQANAAKITESGTEIGAVLVFHDITRLQELDRLKNKFVSNVSHELRTPLTNMKLYMQLLQHGKPDKQTEYLAIMERETFRLERLIVDLLDISRLDQRGVRRHEAIELDEVVRSVIEATRIQATAKGLGLAYESPTFRLPAISGDRDQLTQVLMNLISNAINYTPEGRVITVSIWQTDRDLHASVRDSGIGIEPTDLAHIFERFYRGGNVQALAIAGTGLGLAICKEIITLHGGSIEAQSIVGEGSIFHFTLPIADPEAAPNRPTETTAPPTLAGAVITMGKPLS